MRNTSGVGKKKSSRELGAEQASGGGGAGCTKGLHRGGNCKAWTGCGLYELVQGRGRIRK